MTRRRIKRASVNLTSLYDALDLITGPLCACRYIHRMKVKNAHRSSISAEQMQAMKRSAQDRDRALMASGAVLPESMLFISREMLLGAKVKWPERSLLDEPRPGRRPVAPEPDLGVTEQPASRP